MKTLLLSIAFVLAFAFAANATTANGTVKATVTHAAIEFTVAPMDFGPFNYGGATSAEQQATLVGYTTNGDNTLTTTVWSDISAPDADGGLTVTTAGKVKFTPAGAKIAGCDEVFNGTIKCEVTYNF